jgi:LysM repeat protein
MKKTLCFAAISAGTVLAGAGVASAQEASLPPDEAASHPHTVAPGESLSKISQAELGTSDRWVEIFAVNRDVLADPDAIDVGQVIDIPSVPVAVPPDLLTGLASTPSPASASQRRAATNVRQQAAGTGGVLSKRSGDGHLGAIRACESGGNYRAVSANGRYRGAYQFDRQTWQSVGGSGDPAAASPGEQDARASQLRAQRGSNPWPNCG